MYLLETCSVEHEFLILEGIFEEKCSYTVNSHKIYAQRCILANDYRNIITRLK